MALSHSSKKHFQLTFVFAPLLDFQTCGVMHAELTTEKRKMTIPADGLTVRKLC
jgi:hypothetical protein